MGGKTHTLGVVYKYDKSHACHICYTQIIKNPEKVTWCANLYCTNSKYYELFWFPVGKHPQQRFYPGHYYSGLDLSTGYTMYSKCTIQGPLEYYMGFILCIANHANSIFINQYVVHKLSC